MNYIIYWLISENSKKTYVGFSNDIKRRIHEHRNSIVKTTRDFGKFKIYVIERVANIEQARIREKYWKSAAGRKKLKTIFERIK